MKEDFGMENCPCGSKKTYDACCGVFIEGKEKAKTPEELMRSRYSAYTKGDIRYIMATMQGPAAQGFDPTSALKWAQSVTWKKLEVLNSSMDKNRGLVEFIAHYDDEHGKEKKMHEKSQFVLDEENQVWYYVDGENISHTPYVAESRPGRNDPCSCGSGKKYKKCCMT
jgi:SEC-C motif-containing protein